MASPPVPDEVLKKTYEAYIESGRNQTKTATILGIARRTLQERLQKAERKGFHLSLGGQEAMSLTRLSGVEIAGGYRHVYDSEGKKVETVRWSAPKAEMELETVLDKITAAFSGMKPAARVAKPKHTNRELCTVYAIADAHIGQLSWGREVGEDYDTNIAVARLRDWIARLVEAAPNSKEAIILDVGDTTHIDDNTGVTPRGKHALDVDSRYFRTIEETVAALSDAVDLTLAKHENVKVVILEGNHSPQACVALMFALAERYRLNPRVSVRKEPGVFWVDEFGENMFAATHGDKTTPQRAVMFMADEYAETWGRTRHRFLWTGHLHSAKMQDIGGVKHEQLRAMTSRDAYAYSSAFVSRSQLQAITFHAYSGELQRSYVGL